MTISKYENAAQMESIIDGAVQSAKIGNTTVTKIGTQLQLPIYPTISSLGAANNDLSNAVSNSLQTTNKSVIPAINELYTTKIHISQKGMANGVATLDLNTKIPMSQINDSLIGNVQYQGLWNASTNVPDLTTVKPKGQYFIVSVGITNRFDKNWAVGDWIISNGTSWDKVDNTDAVSSVSGRTGNVTLTKTDVGLANVDNTSDSSKPVSTAVQTALNNKVDKITGKGLSANDYTTNEKTKLAGIQAGAQVNSVTSVAGRAGAVILNKSDVGLANVDNTSDMDKPISTATQTELNAKQSTANIDTINITSVVTRYPSSYLVDTTFQKKNDTTLTTTAKTVVGAINGLNADKKNQITIKSTIEYAVTLAVNQHMSLPSMSMINITMPPADGVTSGVVNETSINVGSVPAGLNANFIGNIVWLGSLPETKPDKKYLFSFMTFGKGGFWYGVWGESV